jgi:hypothetical protein
MSKCACGRKHEIFYFSFSFSCLCLAVVREIFSCLCYGYIATKPRRNVTIAYLTFGTMTACVPASRRSQAFFHIFQLLESSHISLTTNNLQLTTNNLQSLNYYLFNRLPYNWRAINNVSDHVGVLRTH